MGKQHQDYLFLKRAENKVCFSSIYDIRKSKHILSVIQVYDYSDNCDAEAPDNPAYEYTVLCQYDLVGSSIGKYRLQSGKGMLKVR